MTSFATRLRIAMGRQTREQLASSSGVGTRTISRLLAGGEPRGSTAWKLARGLGIREEWLLTGNGDMKEVAVPVYGVSDEEHLAGASHDLAEVMPITPAQRLALQSSIILAMNAIMASKQPLSPRAVAAKSLRYFDIIAAMPADNVTRLAAMDAAVGTDVEKALKEPKSGA